MNRRDDEVSRARAAIEAAGLTWYQPHVTGGEDGEDGLDGEDEVGLEWWNRGRYLSWAGWSTAGWSLSYYSAPGLPAPLSGDWPRADPAGAAAGLVEAYRRLVA